MLADPRNEDVEMEEEEEEEKEEDEVGEGALQLLSEENNLGFGRCGPQLPRRKGGFASR